MKPGFDLLAHPTVYNANRIESIAAAAALVPKHEVNLRGWNFPHTDRKNAAPFSNGFQSSTVWDRYIEGYRLYLSGLFMWRRAYWEDAEGHKSESGRPVLSFISAIWSFTEYFLFLSRLYEGIAPDATVHVAITLRGCKGRELVSLDRNVHFWSEYLVAQDDVIRQEREVQVTELRASHLTIASEMAKRVLHVFQWLDVSDEMIAGWQQRLLKRQFS